MKQLGILAITLIILTSIVIICNPKHKEVRIVNSNYELENKDIASVETKTANVQNKNVAQNVSVNMNNVPQPVVNQNMNVQNQKVVQTQKTPAVKNVETTKSIPAKTTTVKQTTTQKTTVKPVQQQKPVAQKKVTQPVANKPATAVKPAPVTQPQPKPVVTPKTETKVQPTVQQKAQEKAAQEAISWNKWRANVHNQIISQVNLPNVPEGTMFTYSFTVTKDGTISNVKTSSVAPQYTAYAIQYIAPVVRRSAHAAFLKFPAGTERTVVDVQYKFKTTNSGSGSQASANNFNDVEIVKK